MKKITARSAPKKALRTAGAGNQPKTPTTAVGVLRAARDLLSEPDRWTRGYFARTKDGVAVEESSPHAVCWCAAGAIRRAGGGGFPSIAYTAARSFLAAASTTGSIVEYNDKPGRRHPEILSWFDRAIAQAAAVAKPRTGKG